MEKEHLNALTRRILGSAIEVHRQTGPGLLESTYRKCLLAQLGMDGLRAVTEVEISIPYKGIALPAAYRADLIVEGAVLVEIKAIEALLPVHSAQTLTYMRHAPVLAALLINFNEPTLMKGVRRFVEFSRLGNSSALPSAAT